MLFGLAAIVLLTGPASRATRPGVPTEITAYYRAYNFVNAFSTPAERRVLAQGTTAPKDRRLASVARALARLASETEELDPGIVFGFRTPDLPPRHESEFSSEIAQIRSWQADEVTGEAWVELELLSLDEETTGLLVGSFDRLTHGGKSMPEAADLVTVARRYRLRTLERHRWRRLEGGWQRAAAVFTLTSP